MLSADETRAMQARKKAEKGVARGVAQMEAEDYIGAAKNFAKSAWLRSCFEKLIAV